MKEVYDICLLNDIKVLAVDLNANIRREGGWKEDRAYI
jgi:hypothetical protein